MGRLASIIVPFWDHVDLLSLWADSIKHVVKHQVIFVDNGSEPENARLLEQFCREHGIDRVRFEENRGWAAANNAGADVVDGDYLLFMNNDVVLNRDPVPTLVHLAQDGIGGFGPMTSEEGTAYIEGWALTCSQEVYDRIGGFDTRYGPGYWDDVDFCYAATRLDIPLNGSKLVDNVVWHIVNTTGCDGRLDQSRLHVENRRKFREKWELGGVNSSANTSATAGRS